MTMFCFIASIFAQQCLLLNVKHPVVKQVPQCQIGVFFNFVPKRLLLSRCHVQRLLGPVKLLTAAFSPGGRF